MTERRPFYHDGMVEFQDRFDGRRVADALAKHRRRYDFWDDDRKLIEETPFFFIATSYGEYVDCSLRSGAPGFVKIVGPGSPPWRKPVTPVCAMPVRTSRPRRFR